MPPVQLLQATRNVTRPARPMSSFVASQTPGRKKSVALMVFEHQMHMVNLFTRADWEVRFALYLERTEKALRSHSVCANSISNGDCCAIPAAT